MRSIFKMSEIFLKILNSMIEVDYLFVKTPLYRSNNIDLSLFFW